MSKMVKCKTCNNEIASSAKSCPNCGAKNKKAFYKKWWFWLIIVVVVVGIAGASGGNDGDNTSNVVDTSSETTSNDSSESTSNNKTQDETKEFYSVGEEIKINDIILIVNSVEKSNGSQYDRPSDGNEYVIVNVTIKNVGSSEISYNPYYFDMQNSQGQIIDKTITLIDQDTQLNDGKLAAGGQVSGTIVFEEPTGDEGLILKYNPNLFSSKEVKVKLN